MSNPSHSPATPGASGARLVWPLQAQLGEGPIWLPASDSLWFVDIEGCRLHHYHPASDTRESFRMPGRVSFVVPCDDGALLAGIELELHHIVDGKSADCLATVGGNPHCRTNDATVDPQGRLWFGTMDLAKRESIGQVHVFDGRTMRAVGGACPITNGPALSPDGGMLYHVDTLGGTVWAFDIRNSDALVDGRVLIRIASVDGTPDGVTVDSQGCVWVALWGGWAVRRYSPDGELLLEVPIPCAQVTKVAFGGDDLRTAYVTTARTGLSDGELLGQPDAGGVFEFDAPAPGIAPYAFVVGGRR